MAKNFLFNLFKKSKSGQEGYAEEAPVHGQIETHEQADAPKHIDTPEQAETLNQAEKSQQTAPPEPIDSSIWQEIEDTLILADFGSDFAQRAAKHTQQQAEKLRIEYRADVLDLLREYIESEISGMDPAMDLSARPAVVIFVGVNGVGKTTTLGKFANFLTLAQKSVIIAAADTFRAAADTQLAIWAQRAGAEIVLPQAQGADAASVAYQAVKRAIDENIDIVLIDTSGRMHNKIGLMDELAKIKRVVEKLAKVSEVLLVLDANTGQNGLEQASVFVREMGVSGIAICKLDSNAKAGFAARAAKDTGIPIKLIGTGEGIEDIFAFNAEEYANGIVN